jgi:hypothetical protein
MAEPSEGAVALARLRAARVQVRPQEPAALRRLTAAAGRAGRTLVQVPTTTTRGAGLLLGWLDGSEPVDQEDSGVQRRQPSPTVLLTFAACLRACWPDPGEEPYPGRVATERQVLAALAALTSPGAAPPGEDGGGAERHYKSALRLLRATGLLDPAAAQVRLGPVVALWPASDVAVLRRFHDRLPACPPGGQR